MFVTITTMVAHHRQTTISQTSANFPRLFPNRCQIPRLPGFPGIQGEWSPCTLMHDIYSILYSVNCISVYVPCTVFMWKILLWLFLPFISECRNKIDPRLPSYSKNESFTLFTNHTVHLCAFNGLLWRNKQIVCASEVI